MATDKKYFYGLGRRKSATARVRLYAGKGKVTINDQTPEEVAVGLVKLVRLNSVSRKLY